MLASSGTMPLQPVVPGVIEQTSAVTSIDLVAVRVQPSLSVTVSVYVVFGASVGVTLNDRHVVPDGSPTVLCVAVLPSSPVTVTVNGPRDGGAVMHACSVVVPPQPGVQFAMHVNA